MEGGGGCSAVNTGALHLPDTLLVNKNLNKTNDLPNEPLMEERVTGTLEDLQQGTTTLHWDSRDSKAVSAETVVALCNKKIKIENSKAA